MKKYNIIFYCFLLIISLPYHPAYAQLSGKAIVFNSNWKFHKGDVSNGQDTGINIDSWRSVDLPHDWSIEGPFSDEWASATGYLPGGIGWYQKSFTAPADWKSKNVSIYFDGVYKNSTVWMVLYLFNMGFRNI
jgi:beta-galactosidase